MKVILSPLLSDARKKIGNAVFTRTQAGAMVRKRVVPKNPKTTAQVTVRANFKANSVAYAALGADIIAEWNAFAQAHPLKDRLGNTFTPSGLQMYQRIARNRHTIGQTPLATPPAVVNPDDAQSVACAYAAGATPTLTATTGQSISALDYIVIFATAGYGQGRTNLSKKFRLVHFEQGSDDSSFEFLSDYVKKFGTYPAGKKVDVKAFTIEIATGWAGPAYQSTVTESA